MINPMPDLKKWGMRFVYGLLLQVPLLVMMHYYPSSPTFDAMTLTNIGDILGIIYLMIVVWWSATTIITFWYLQKYTEFWSDQLKKKYNN